MNLNARLLLIGSLASLASIPLSLWFALDSIPPLSVIRTEVAGNRMGPWVFTWGLVWIAVLAAILLAWLSYLASRMATDDSTRHGAR